MTLKHLTRILGLSVLLISGAFAPTCGSASDTPDMTLVPDMTELPDMTVEADMANVKKCPTNESSLATKVPCDCYGTIATQDDVDNCSKTLVCCPGQKILKCE